MQSARDGRPLVMGVLNVTPDSFSDGGRYLATADALARGRQMIAEGADVVDVGGESSRPGATPVAEAEELRRVLPVIEALAGAVRVSVDTVKPEVARRAVAAGATLVNDISGTLWPVAAELSVGWVAMHMQGTPADMQRDPRYGDVVEEVHSTVLGRAATATAAGVPEVWVDPGIGFGKTAAHNVALLRHVRRLVDAAAHAGHRVLVGTSRKSFLGRLSAGTTGAALAVEDRLEASVATAGWSMIQGVAMVRVHDVAETAELATLVGAAVRGKWAAGIPPRNFTWVIRDRLAVSERPGGFAPNHRRVRRHEEIIWLRAQGFDRVVSLLVSTHNLAAYDEEGMAWSHFPLAGGVDPRAALGDCYQEIDRALADGQRVIVHQEELGDRVMGTVAGYLVWSGRLPSGPQAVSMVEHLVGRQLGAVGRQLVVEAESLPPHRTAPSAQE